MDASAVSNELELRLLLARIAIEGYDTVEQIVGDIHSRIEEIKSDE
jgi:hypothetical protein